MSGWQGAPLRKPARDHKPQLAHLCRRGPLGKPGQPKNPLAQALFADTQDFGAPGKRQPRIASADPSADIARRRNVADQIPQSLLQHLGGEDLGGRWVQFVPAEGPCRRCHTRILPETFSTVLVSGGLSRSEAFPGAGQGLSAGNGLS